MHKPKYTHLSQRNQILKRPGQHIGSTKNHSQEVWIAQTEYDGEKEIDSIIKQEINYNSGLIHIFYEVLGNAQDNYFRSKNSSHPLKKIEVNVNQDTGEISVWNDGLWIPAIVHQWTDDEEIIDKKDHYEAEIIFGHLNSSSNYDDSKNKRVGGGLHGVGVKLTNIFSSHFYVEACDPENNLKYIGEWKDNMSILVSSKVVKSKKSSGYTKVTYTVDFSKFGVKQYSDELVSVMKKLCFDSAMITGQNIIFNGDKIPAKTLLKYSNFYTENNKVEFTSNDSSVIFCEKPQLEPGFVQMSFVNGINTQNGGVHVDEWKKAIFKPLMDKIKAKYNTKKGSTPLKLTYKTLEQYFMIFVNCNLENPEFVGQTKDVLCNPCPKTNVPSNKITSMMKWSFMEDIEETIRLQNMKELKKIDGKKTTHVNVHKAEDANYAGTAKSSSCTLFITEGDSAKTFAVKGISAMENGTNFYGALPVRGKVLNVRGASLTQIQNNAEITNLNKMLGLRHNVDYSKDENFKTLRYGKVVALTDADPDGDHIKGLIINYFQYFYPSLISRNFIGGIRIPIVKATIGKKVINFYYLKDFKKWETQQTQKFTAKYYKGLGTSEDKEIIDLFEKPLNIQFVSDKHMTNMVSLVFDKKRSDDRKKWLEKYKEEEFVYQKNKIGNELVPISDFFNKEMINFSIYDNKRSIPSVMDGFKPSQRKAMWVGLKELTKNECKVAQFAAKVAEKAEYHHGEASMQQTIIGMCQTYLGANNIALFQENGQFGTRLAGGKDAAAPRYIFTKLSSITRYIFRKEDDPILNYLEEDGKKIEPQFFVPIVPIILINGCHGIGTGYSTDIPSFNPIDLVNWIKEWINKEATFEHKYRNYPILQPWYWGFKGRVVQDKKNRKKYTYYGQVSKLDTNCFEIKELPVGIWTDDYKEHLNHLQTGISKTKKTAVTAGYSSMTIKQLKDELEERELQISGTKKILIDRLKDNDKENGTNFKASASTSGQLVKKWEWYGDAYNINFKVWTRPNVSITYDSKFKLTSSESLTNMTAFTPTGGMKKYNGINDILRTFCKVRFEYYEKRKKYLLEILRNNLREQRSKAKFISEALKDFKLLKQTEQQLFEYFDKNGYYKKICNENEDDNGHCYNYLTNMPIRTFTKDHYEKLLKKIEDIKEEIKYIKNKTTKDMWRTELDEFVKEYTKWKTEIESYRDKMGKTKIRRK